MPIHTVQQGEHISRLAKENGFPSYLTIWNHPQNADLKAKRQNPNVLYPGDQVFIPDRDPKGFDAVTDKTHVYEVNGKPLRLRVIVQDHSGQPLPHQHAVLTLEGSATNVQSGGDGMIDQRIAPVDEDGTLVFQDPDPIFLEAIDVRLGYLDPIDAPSGWIARLNNLGYRAGLVPPPSKEEQSPDPAVQDPDAQKMLKSAVEEFQCDHFLTVDGICGPETQAKLKQVYGC